MSMIRVKERPILFSGPMILALLAGRKTQTRRVIKPQPASHLCAGSPIWGHGISRETPENFSIHAGVDVDGKREDHWIQCPYGKVGDKIWVRESFSVSGIPDGYLLTYTADGATLAIDNSEIEMGRLKVAKSYPSIHMPRWASRLTLTITDIRVQQVKDISEEDACAEGVPAGYHRNRRRISSMMTSRERFADLWEVINGDKGPHSWQANPWVWAVSFSVDKPEAPHA